LREKQLLLILDNLEQILDAAPKVVELLAACPSLRVLATSREALHLRGERVFSVVPLSVPDFTPAPACDLMAITEYESVQLFLDRTSMVMESFRLTRENVPAIAELCIQLDGIPLAIELAAARINLLSPGALLERLHGRLSVLGHGPRDLPIRQQTLEATIDWSYELLDDDLKWLFVALSVFSAGCTLEAAESVLSGIREGMDVFEGVHSLVEKSLLVRINDVKNFERIGMLQTIRTYASAKRKSLEDASKIEAMHANYYFHFATSRSSEVEGKNQLAILTEIETEIENIHNAFRALGDESDSQFAIMIADLWRFYRFKGRYIEAREYIGVAIKGLGVSDSRLRARLLLADGVLQRCVGENEASMSTLQKALRIAYENKYGEVLAELSYELGWTFLYLNRPHHAEMLFNRSAESSKRNNEDVQHAMALQGLGGVALHRGMIDKAKQATGEALRIFNAHGLQRQQALALANLGYAVAMESNYDTAIEIFQRAEQIADLVGERDQHKAILQNIGDLYEKIGDNEKAADYCSKLKSLATETGDLLSLSRAHNGLSQYFLHTGDYHKAFEHASSAKKQLEVHDSSPEYGMNLRLFGDIYRNRNETRRAKSMYRASIAVLEKTHSSDELEKARKGLEESWNTQEETDE
jgi:non-specific serine/threonine protein kinase